MVTRFRLQLGLDEIAAYAARFDDGADVRVLANGRAAHRRGYYTRREFTEACRWKTPRSAPLVARNTVSEVRRASHTALAGDTLERERMRALRQLHGVGWPTASVLLHLTSPDCWPILDVRVLHALGLGDVTYGYAFWEALVQNHRDLVQRAGTDGRTLDRGLWQWSAEH